MIDEATIEVASGRGGNGAATFHREKHVPRGGPNGADGGRGGDVVLVADHHRRTLHEFGFKTRFEGGMGTDAVGNKSGKDGLTIEIRVPEGTTIFDAKTGEKLADLVGDGTKFVAARGGRGGKGNLHYTNSVRQSPGFAQKGEPAEERVLRLELKLLADVGIVGLPNAGKSTLISRISAAKPRIADYPFTTIEPNLGVVSVRDTSFVVADMPGLIEGASEGRGLGHQFLRHVERTRVLLHLVEAMPLDESDPMENFALVEEELSKYSPELAARPRVIAVSKCDTVSEDVISELVSKFKSAGFEVLTISAVSGRGIDGLLDVLAQAIEDAPREPMTPVLRPMPEAARTIDWHVEETDGGYVVTGRTVERIVAMTDLRNQEALQYLHHKLGKMGVLEKLREAGADDGSTVRIGDFEFEFSERG